VLRMCYEVSERRVCEVLSLSRTSCRYCSRADEQAALRIRIRDLAYAQVSYGYRRLHILLQREGWKINHKRVYRLYHLEGLGMRPKRHRRHVTGRRRMERVEAIAPNEGWSMDLMADELFNGQRIRLLTLVDNFTRESLAIEVDTHLGGHRVVAVLQRIGMDRPLPKIIRVDNGPEFISKVLDQ
jgi:putative transposase